MRIALVPLDERPVNVRYPSMIGAIAGAEVMTPPPELLSQIRTSAPVDQLAAWLTETSESVDALIVSVDMLVYGGAIPSRISDDTAEVVLERLEILRTIKTRLPNLRVYGFNLITRIDLKTDPIEEPDYWTEYGEQLYRMSLSISRRKDNAVETDSWKRSFEGIPTAIVADFFKRRARNHQINRAALTLIADGVIDLLILSADDPDAYSLTRDEKKLLTEQIAQLGVGSRVMMINAADEAASMLVARLINEQAGHAPSFQPVYLIPEGQYDKPLFDEMPMRSILERQIKVVGASLNKDDGEVLLLINPPVMPAQEWVRDFLHEDEPEDRRLAAYDGAANAIGAALTQGRQVALADVGYANGASHDLMISLDASGVDNDLIAFAAWGTAANTIGTAVATACAVMHGANPKAADRFLAHRLIEDWGYQTITRTLARKMIESETGVSEPTPERMPELLAWVAQGLERFAATHKLGYRPVNVRFPWGRTYEIDFELEKINFTTNSSP